MEAYIPVVCETSTDKIRPYISEQFRKQAFLSVHNLSHPGIRTSKKLVKERFFWDSMNKDIGKWAKGCLNCQRAKVGRHIKSQLGTFPSADRFTHIHVDIVGPLNISIQDYRYLVTIIDRQTGWPEAYPVKDISAETVAKVVVEGWIARFGCPVKLTSDQGRQFESNLFKELMKCFGIDKIRTSPYHAQANGMVERFHRSLKAALMARLDSSTWVEELPMVMLGLRTATRNDTGVSAAQMTFGTTLRLPGDFYAESSSKIRDHSQYVENLRNSIRKLKPKPVAHKDARTLFVHPDLAKVEYVFVRDDTVRKPLKAPYDGPYRVLERRAKVYIIQLPGRQSTISIDRLKPAYTFRSVEVEADREQDKLSENISTSVVVPGCSKENVCDVPSKNADIEPATKLTPKISRSGRAIKRPVRFS